MFSIEAGLTLQRKRKEAKQLKSWLSKDALRRMLEEPRCLWKVRQLSSDLR